MTVCKLSVATQLMCIVCGSLTGGRVLSVVSSSLRTNLKKFACDFIELLRRFEFDIESPLSVILVFLSFI